VASSKRGVVETENLGWQFWEGSKSPVIKAGGS
jgi:hypothetical protein